MPLQMKEVFMKFLILAAFLMSAGVAQAAPITYTQVVIEKNSKSATGVFFTSGLTREHYCAGFRGALEFGSFDAAKKAEAMADGVYVCNGEFVHSQPRPLVQAFSISGCGQPSDKSSICN